MAAQCWLKKRDTQQGSAMLMVLGLLSFILALGAIVFRSAQMREELARERYAYRSTMNILESMTTAACAAEASSWCAMMKDHPDVVDIGSYTLTVQGVTYHLEVTAEKGDVLMRAFCDGKQGAPIVLSTRLSFDGIQAVIREQKRTL